MMLVHNGNPTAKMLNAAAKYAADNPAQTILVIMTTQSEAMRLREKGELPFPNVRISSMSELGVALDIKAFHVSGYDKLFLDHHALEHYFSTTYSRAVAGTAL